MLLLDAFFAEFCSLEGWVVVDKLLAREGIGSLGVVVFKFRANALSWERVMAAASATRSPFSSSRTFFCS